MAVDAHGMQTETRNGVLFCIVSERAFARLLEGAHCVGNSGNEIAWRKGHSLLAQEIDRQATDEIAFRYVVCPNFFLMQGGETVEAT